MDRRGFIGTLIAFIASRFAPAEAVEVTHLIDARGVDVERIKEALPRVIVEGLPHLDLDWKKLLFTYIDVSGKDNMVLETEFFVKDKWLELNLCAYINQGANLNDVPVMVHGLSDGVIKAKCLYCDVWYPDKWPPKYKDIGPGRPTLFRMHLLYEGDVDGQA